MIRKRKCGRAAAPCRCSARLTCSLWEGGFAGIAAALEYARSGYRVVVVEPRTYLGREATATLRPWALLPKDGGAGHLWEQLATSLGMSEQSMALGEVRLKEVPLKMDTLKLCLEEMLSTAGIELIYASQPAGLCSGEDGVEALIIGNKSGRQAITAPLIVDASEAASVARFAGATFLSAAPSHVRYNRTLEFDGVGPLDKQSLPVPRHLGLANDKVVLHRGYRGEEHLLVECELELPFEDGPEGYMRREVAARLARMRLAEYLLSEVPAFAGSVLATTSYELHGPQTGVMGGSVPDWARGAEVIKLTLEGANPQPELLCFAGPCPGLWCLNEAARLEEDQSRLLRDPVTAAQIGEAFAKACIKWMTDDGRRTTNDEPLNTNYRRASSVVPPLSTALRVSEPDSPQRGRDYPQYAVEPEQITVLDVERANVLVVGGGTSGATAAREGLRVALLEMNPGLGGTGTLGGVDSYWYGRHVGFAARVSRLTEEVQRCLRYTRPKWSVEAKMYALLREAEGAGVRTIFNAITIGAITEENRVRGVVVATRWGLFAVLADVVIDATGDGDVAAFAGADYVYGSERDHTVMWYSLAQFVTPGRTRNNSTSMADVSNIEDYTRAILAGRRRGNGCYDHGVYLAPRETRHILGDVVMTHTDQLLRRRWTDVVNIHYSNHDVKGPSDSPWVRMGLIPPNLEIEIPFRMLLPKGLEGIIVAGKAISATHAALPAIRMQADMENLGGVAGLAAAQAVQTGKLPRDISIADLQHRLVKEGLLPPDVTSRSVGVQPALTTRHLDATSSALKPEPGQRTEAELQSLVASLSGDKPLYAYSDMEMGEIFDESIPMVQVCTAGPAIVPVLEQELGSATGRRRLLLAQALAMYRSSAAAPVLIEEIERAMSGEKLPARDSQIRHAGFPPDQGAMPDVVYLLYSLGMCRDARSIPVWTKVADLLEATEEDICDRHKGTFYYVDAVCFGAEELGDPAAVPSLEKLHSYPALRGQAALSGVQPDFFKERQALLELAITRALARCGSPKGVAVLIGYLNDVRALLAEQAHSALIAATGRDFGKNGARWTDWLDAGT